VTISDSDYKLKQVVDDYKAKEDQIRGRNEQIKKLTDGFLASEQNNIYINSENNTKNNETIFAKLVLYEEKINELRKNQDQLIGELVETKNKYKECLMENEKLKIDIHQTKKLNKFSPESNRYSNKFSSKVSFNLEKLMMEKKNINSLRTELDEVRDGLKIENNLFRQN